jgi:hypothetical protein
VRYPPVIGRLAGVAAEAGALLRRRRESRRPRVRVRVAHGETRVIAEDAPEHERIRSLAEELVAEHSRSGRGRR